MNMTFWTVSYSMICDVMGLVIIWFIYKNLRRVSCWLLNVYFWAILQLRPFCYFTTSVYVWLHILMYTRSAGKASIRLICGFFFYLVQCIFKVIMNPRHFHLGANWCNTVLAFFSYYIKRLCVMILLWFR